MSSAPDLNPELLKAVHDHLQRIYPVHDTEPLVTKALNIFNDSPRVKQPETKAPPWTEQDAILITYGNSICQENETPLKTLETFLDTRINDLFSILHILPFFPFSSDDGFAVL